MRQCRWCNTATDDLGRIGLCRECRLRKRGYTEGETLRRRLMTRGQGGKDMPPLPDHPTIAQPGSPEKIEVLTGRASRGEMLFHPLDAGMDVVHLSVSVILGIVDRDSPYRVDIDTDDDEGGW